MLTNISSVDRGLVCTEIPDGKFLKSDWCAVNLHPELLHTVSLCRQAPVFQFKGGGE